MPKTKTKPADLKKAMNKAKSFKQWVNRTLDTIIKDDLLMDFVDLECIYHSKDSGSNHNCVFSMIYQKKYRMGTINIYPNAYKLYADGNINELITGLTHELCHLHTIPVEELARNRFTSDKEISEAFEELTQTIAEYIKRGRKKYDR